jgi:hypothetical protein
MVVLLVATVAIALGAIACTPMVTSPGPAEATIESPVVIPIESPSPAELEAIRLRTDLGLRSDLDYVRAVAANPLASSREYGVPLLPGELAELSRRAANLEAIRDVVVAYTEARPLEFAGMYIDNLNGRALTTMWTANVELHAAAIRSLVRPGAPVAFRSARFTYLDLRALQDRIEADRDWMRAQVIALLGVGVHVEANQVFLQVSSANPRAPEMLLARYAVPIGMISVESDGTGAALIPRGTVRGQVLDSLGKPPGEAVANELRLEWTSDGPGTCGGGDIGYGLTADGRFELPCQAGGHTILVQTMVGEQDWKTIGTGHLVAIGGGTIELAITLGQPWSSVIAP